MTNAKSATLYNEFYKHFHNNIKILQTAFSERSQKQMLPTGIFRFSGVGNPGFLPRRLRRRVFVYMCFVCFFCGLSGFGDVKETLFRGAFGAAVVPTPRDLASQEPITVVLEMTFNIGSEWNWRIQWE